jgi:thiol-disulfide isomerase/thioredoxin
MMTLSRLSVSAAILAGSIAAAAAAERIAYQPAVFEAALESGQPILVHVTAPWCGECKLQKPIVATLAAQPEYAGLTIVDVDFDTQKDALRRLGVQKQSTLVIYKDRTERARAVGITRREAIEDLMQNAR